MTYAVNQWIHDPLNGIGQVKSFEQMTISNQPHQFMVLRFENPKFLVRVPMATLDQRGIRPLCSKQDIKKVMSILKKPKKTYKVLWSQKTIIHEKKLLSGNLEEIAEVVRDLQLPQNNLKGEQSYTEHILYQKAFTRLVQEIALVEKSETALVEQKLTQLLSVA